MQLTAAAEIQDQTLAAASFTSGSNVPAGGMLAMPSHPGLFQHLGCCRKVPGAHNPAVTFWPVDTEVSISLKAFFLPPLAFLSSLHLWQLEGGEEKK